MGRTFLRQDAQIRNSVLYDDTLAVGSTLESASVSAEGDFNAVRSQLKRALYADNAGDWWEDINTPGTFESGAKRGIRNLNLDLHELERKRVLVRSDNLASVTVTAAQNWQVLTLGQLPTNLTAAIGAVSTRGTVAAAHGGTFGSHSLTVVSGLNVVNPKNLCEIVDAATRDQILSGGRVIYALFHTESSTDGSTMSGTTANRAQLSFVRINAAGTALEAVPSADIAGKTIQFACAERKALDDLNEQDFLRGAVTDLPTATTVSRQVAYDNQGTTPVELTANADLDLNAAAITWRIRDLANATLFRVLEGSTGGTSEVQLGQDVDLFNVDAVVSDFANAVKVGTAGLTEIDIGVNDGVIESTGTKDLMVKGALELYLNDGNQTGSTWAQSGIKLSEDTAEWDAFEAAYGGEVSLLSAIVSAKNSVTRNKTVAVVTTNVAADVDVGGTGGGSNLDAQLGDYSGKTFLTDVDIYLNGQLLRNGANAGANHDVYPGTSAALGQLKFEFALHGSGGNPDVISMVIW